MGILVRAGRLLGLVKVPRVGDKVWWAPKEVGGLVTKREMNGTIVFQGGEIVINKKGRAVPRWTVGAGVNTYRWDESLQMWIVGQGKLPKNVRGDIVTPDPVAASGSSQGSFAVKKD